MEECVFCKIVNRDIPSSIVHEDRNAISFLDMLPANKGHCLVVPKKHCSKLDEMDDKDIFSLLSVVKRVAKALSLSNGIDGYNVLMNNGWGAGQVINHAHIHLIPRYRGDLVELSWPRKKYDETEVQKLKNKIKKFL